MAMMCVRENNEDSKSRRFHYTFRQDKLNAHTKPFSPVLSANYKVFSAVDQILFTPNILELERCFVEDETNAGCLDC